MSGSLTCPHCGHTAPEDDWEWELGDDYVDAHCPECDGSYNDDEGE